MSVVLYPSNLKSSDPTKQLGVSDDKIGAFLSKTGSLAAPLTIRGHKDHILAMLEANKSRHVNVLFQENKLYAFCVPSLEPTKRKYRVGGAKTAGVSVAMLAIKAVSQLVRGKYMTLHVTDSEMDVNAHGGNPRQVEYSRTVTFADLKAVVSSA